MVAVVKCLVLVYLIVNVCYCSSPVNELLETVMHVLNDCSRFYPNANNFIVVKLLWITLYIV